MAETHTVTAVDHTKGAETDPKSVDTKDVKREIVHENADEKPPSMMQKTTGAIAQGVMAAKEAVVGKSEPSKPSEDEDTVAEALAHESSPIIRD